MDYSSIDDGFFMDKALIALSIHHGFIRFIEKHRKIVCSV